MPLQSALALNQAAADPDLRGTLDLVKKEVFLDLASQHVGKIQSFDPLTQLATVSINYLRTYFEKNAAGVYGPKQVSYPLLIDVPVIGLRGGSASLTMPIAKGDDCLLLINDRDIDVWFSGSSNSPVASSRLHSLTDAFALVGVRSRADVLVGYDSARAVLQNGLSSRVAVASDGPSMEYGGSVTPSTPPTYGVKVKSVGVDVFNSTDHLGALLTTLIGQLKDLSDQIKSLSDATAAITVTYINSGGTPTPTTVPINAAAITAVGTAVTTIKTALGTTSSKIAGLLV